MRKFLSSTRLLPHYHKEHYHHTARGGEVIAPGRIVGEDIGSVFGLLETPPKALKKNQILVAKTVINTAEEYIPIRILNPTKKPRTIYGDTVVAECEEVDTIFQREEQSVRAASTRQLLTEEPGQQDTEWVPQHLTDLFDRSTQHLDTRQRS